MLDGLGGLFMAVFDFSLVGLEYKKQFIYILAIDTYIRMDIHIYDFLIIIIIVCLFVYLIELTFVYTLFL